MGFRIGSQRGDFPLDSPSSRARADGGDEARAGLYMELLRVNFLAGTGKESSAEETLVTIHRLLHLPPREHQAGIADQGGAGKRRPRKHGEANEADQAEDADLPAADDVMPQRDERPCQKCGSL